MSVDLNNEIKTLRKNFHLKLAGKRNIKTDEQEIEGLVKRMDDESIQNYLERSFELRKWLRFFR